ncbi:1-deoxy-D-xylulose-5-phosphate synthase [Streptomyces sp. RPA4-5]|uniref:1-deoxy-D-xylulose-5-phosphate synthase n=1 Tax=Streptomyces TaxID=1883 RepID=UPI00143EADF9|nr:MULTISPECIES: 1-deoxy-D-xylulose-5-phosphate synthase [Streptomyces]MCX4637710.1 1-deoxy-D-xylulose-5-phosphate synthase [Streptomyces platensis]QIY53622.1 1-deoxy-D-xylulose-5-phosphate synthase [Streptomyces sp. RPA4-5]WJY36155.1 1-deoxy-D-xylulose-5-phosphate synthase [Streptomyces sp. P9-2B-2]
MTQLLNEISSPKDLHNLSEGELERLASEVRTFLIEHVSQTGGHLGPNLGVVELTLALHRVFESPKDSIVWDTGHQSYVHKIVTGRRDRFSTLRKKGGLSGYPSQAESAHDLVENSHASTALSYADGLSKAYALRGEVDRCTVAVIGDGALTGGMAWEALNNIAAAGNSRPLVIVVNDNGRSYSPTVGGLARHLSALRTLPAYERFLAAGKEILENTPVVGSPVYETLHGVKQGLKGIVAPQALFEDLGIKYVGPIDGHNVAELENSLRLAKGFGSPVIVHCITEKGRGFSPAERDEAERFHAVGKIDSRTGEASSDGSQSWTSVFSAEIADIGAENPNVTAITAAMQGPVGLSEFGNRHPDRFFDVGIAEQHAVTSAAGMAMAGLHPVVALYSTFLNRAFDQLLMDVALHQCGVTFVLDRAGITGSDGASHNGMWDLSLLNMVPGLRVAVPRDADTLRQELREAVDVTDAPTALRFPKGAVEPAVPALERRHGVDVLYESRQQDVLIVGVGAMAGPCARVARQLSDDGVNATVIDPRWVKPVPEGLIRLARGFRHVVTVEDSGRMGGVGAAVTQALRDAGFTAPVQVIGIPQQFLDHGSRSELLAELQLTEDALHKAIHERVDFALGENGPFHQGVGTPSTAVPITDNA